MHSRAPSPWERVAAGLGALLVAGALAYMVQYGLTHPSSEPPDLSIVHAGTVRTVGGYLVQFRARNDGSATAADVIVGGSLDADGVTLEASEARLDYLPPHSEREGGLLFSLDPTRHELRLRVKGYARP